MSERAPLVQLTGGDGTGLPGAVSPSADGRRPLLDIATHPRGDRMLVALSGAIDLDTEQALQTGLRAALVRSVRGIDLDLSEVDFCDCSGLNVLLRIRRHALEKDRSVAIETASPPVLRLLSVTGTLPLFAVTGEEHRSGPAREPAADAASEDGAGATSLGEADQDLRIELAQLRRAMRTRPVIDLARGILMASFGLSAEEAWTVLVSVSQNTNTKLHQVADSLVDAVTGDALPGPFQREVGEAVATLRTAPATTATG